MFWHVIGIEKACILLRWNSLPSKRYLTGKPASPFWKASVSMTENIMLNSVALFNSMCHRKWFGVCSIILSPHAVMDLLHHCYEPGWTARLCHNLPKRIMTDCVKCFGEVDNGQFVLDISLGAALLWKLCLLFLCSFWIHTDFLLEVQPDQMFIQAI